MKGVDLEIYCWPACREKLELESDSIGRSDSIESGIMICQSCGREYSISNGIPRFVSNKNYADSFGVEWQKFPKTFHDDDWQQIYEQRFFRTTDFASDLRGQAVLEAGCGSGGFTGIILATGARLFSLDLSSAVDVCRENHTNAQNGHLLSLCQADLHALPFALGSFDKVVCLGVIQHCPDPEVAFRNLCQYLKPGGEIVIDCYEKQPLRIASPHHLVKHALRTITKHMPERILLRCVVLAINVLYDLKATINRIPMVGAILHRVIAIGELRRRNWTPDQMKRIKALNVFDMLSPNYDNPQSLKSVRGWIIKEGLQLIKCEIGYNGVNAKARRPFAPSPWPVL